MLVSGLLHRDLTFIYIFKWCGKSSNHLSPYKVSYCNIYVHIPYAICYITVTCFYNLFILLNLLHLFIFSPSTLATSNHLFVLCIYLWLFLFCYLLFVHLFFEYGIWNYSYWSSQNFLIGVYSSFSAQHSSFFFES